MDIFNEIFIGFKKILMKKYNSLLFIALLLAGNIAAQTKNPTNNKEVQDRMKQAQQQLDKLTPSKKR